MNNPEQEHFRESETSQSPFAEAENIDLLETGPRDLVQAHLLIMLFGAENDTAHLGYMTKYNKVISDILNGTSSKSIRIRALARAGKYEEAAKLLLPLVPQIV
ncbi:MAG TPA: hypothetical protein VJB98_01890 [Candidatus Paceibacterota bacterium]